MRSSVLHLATLRAQSRVIGQSDDGDGCDKELRRMVDAPPVAPSAEEAATAERGLRGWLIEQRDAWSPRTESRRLLWNPDIPEPELAYRGPHDFVLREGTFSPYAPTPAGAPVGKKGGCAFNALAIASVNGIPYVEGFAMIAPGFRVVQHAWNLDANGDVVDVTWHDKVLPAGARARASRKGGGYIGIHFSAWRGYDAVWEGDASVLNDHHRGWPLLTEKWSGETMPDDHEKVLAELAAKTGMTKAEFKRRWRLPSK